MEETKFDLSQLELMKPIDEFKTVKDLDSQQRNLL